MSFSLLSADGELGFLLRLLSLPYYTTKADGNPCFPDITLKNAAEDARKTPLW
jgi:hypothetical protein